MASVSMAAFAARPSSIALLIRQNPDRFSASSLWPLILFLRPALRGNWFSTQSLDVVCVMASKRSFRLPSCFLVRDITSNPEWEKAYQYEIPVLAKVLSDDTEETLPRISPRLGVELIQKKIAAALTQ